MATEKEQAQIQFPEVSEIRSVGQGFSQVLYNQLEVVRVLGTRVFAESYSRYSLTSCKNGLEVLNDLLCSYEDEKFYKEYTEIKEALKNFESFVNNPRLRPKMYEILRAYLRTIIRLMGRNNMLPEIPIAEIVE